MKQHNATEANIKTAMSSILKYAPFRKDGGGAVGRRQSQSDSVMDVTQP